MNAEQAAERLSEEVAYVGYSGATVINASELVNLAASELAGDGGRSDLLARLQRADTHQLVGMAYTLAIAAALALEHGPWTDDDEHDHDVDEDDAGL